MARQSTLRVASPRGRPPESGSAHRRSAGRGNARRLLADMGQRLRHARRSRVRRAQPARAARAHVAGHRAGRSATSPRANWHPLTWLSHMLDAQLFGLDAAGHHADERRACTRCNVAAALLRARADDGRARAERVRGGALRAAPAARRVGRLGRGAQGRAVRASSGCSRCSPTRATRAAGAAARTRAVLALVRARAARQADARDAPVRAAAARRLAAAPSRAFPSAAARDPALLCARRAVVRSHAGGAALVRRNRAVDAPAVLGPARVHSRRLSALSRAHALAVGTRGAVSAPGQVAQRGEVAVAVAPCSRSLRLHSRHGARGRGSGRVGSGSR